MKTNLHLVVSLTAFILGSFGLSLQANDAPAQKPNIIFILADDLGIANVGCYGADNYRTPHIDKLAKGGICYTHALRCLYAALRGRPF